MFLFLFDQINGSESESTKVVFCPPPPPKNVTKLIIRNRLPNFVGLWQNAHLGERVHGLKVIILCLDKIYR